MKPIHAADHELAQRVVGGDRAAFQQFFELYYPRLYRFALARLHGDRSAADEAAQQTLCKALEALGAYRGEASLQSWLCQICRNQLTDRWRLQARERSLDQLPEDCEQVRAALESLGAGLADQPEAAAWQRDLQRLVGVALDALPESYSQLLEWKYVDGLAVQDMAARQGLGAKAIESRLQRARVAFKDALFSLGAGREVLFPPEG